MPWGRQARAGRPRAGHSPPANPRALPRWPGAGLLSGSPLAGSSGPRPVSPRRHLGGPVGTQWFSVAAPGGSVSCQARDRAAEAWCPAQPVSCTSLAVPSWGALLSYAAAVPGLPASAQGGRFSCSSPHPRLQGLLPHSGCQLPEGLLSGDGAPVGLRDGSLLPLSPHCRGRVYLVLCIAS